MPPKFTRGAKGKGLTRGESSGQGPSNPQGHNPYRDTGDSSSPFEPHRNSISSGYSPPEDTPEPMDEDSDPEMPATGSMGHPIYLSSGSNSYAGTPQHYPDEYQEKFAQYIFYDTPSYHSTPSHHTPSHHTPSYHTPPPEEQQVEQPQLPPRPPRKRNARMSVRMGPRVGSLSPPPSSYPIIPEDPQMGGPSHTSPYHQPSPAVEPEPQPPLPFGDPFQPPPPQGFDNPIPSYTGPSSYFINTSDWLTHDPYAPPPDPSAYEYPNPFPPAPYPIGGYSHYGNPPPIVLPQPSVAQPQQQPQPQPQQQPQEPPPTIEALNEAIGEVREMQAKTAKDTKKNKKLLRWVVKTLKGKHND